MTDKAWRGDLILMRKWLEPGKVPFLVITIFILVASVACFIMKNEGAIPCAIFGLLGLLVHFKAKKKKG